MLLRMMLDLSPYSGTTLDWSSANRPVGHVDRGGNFTYLLKGCAGVRPIFAPAGVRQEPELERRVAARAADAASEAELQLPQLRLHRDVHRRVVRRPVHGADPHILALR